MLTRKQIEALCLGCNEGEGVLDLRDLRLAGGDDDAGPGVVFELQRLAEDFLLVGGRLS